MAWPRAAGKPGDRKRGIVNGGGVTAANSKGIWRTSSGGGSPALVLRTGDSMTVKVNGVPTSKTILDVDIPGSGYAEHIWDTPVTDQNGRQFRRSASTSSLKRRRIDSASGSAKGVSSVATLLLFALAR